MIKIPSIIYQQAVHSWFGCSIVEPEQVPEDAAPGMEFRVQDAVYQIETRADRCAIAAEQTQYLAAAQLLHPRLLAQALEHACPAKMGLSFPFKLALMQVLSEQSPADPDQMGELLIGRVDFFQEREGQPTMWADFAQVDAVGAAAALVAAERSAALPPGQLAEYLAELCFEQGQEYLAKPNEGLFVRLKVATTDVIIYEIAERNESTAFLAP